MLCDLHEVFWVVCVACVWKSSALFFRHARVSSTYPCLSVGKSYFRISILSVFLVALREKLKREDPNYFSILGMGKIFDPNFF